MGILFNVVDALGSRVMSFNIVKQLTFALHLRFITPTQLQSKIIFWDLHHGGYELKDEWKGKMAWSTEKWNKEGPFAKREWLKVVFLTILGFNIDRHDE